MDPFYGNDQNQQSSSGITNAQLNTQQFYIDSNGKLSLQTSVSNKINNSVSQAAVRINESNIKTTDKNNTQFQDKSVFYFDLATNQWKYKQLHFTDLFYNNSPANDGILTVKNQEFYPQQYITNTEIENETINQNKILNLTHDQTTQNQNISTLRSDVDQLKGKFQINQNNNYVSGDLIVDKISNSGNNHIATNNEEYVTLYNLKDFLKLYNVNGVDLNNFQTIDFKSQIDILTQIVNGLNSSSAQIMIDTTSIQNKLNSIDNLFNSSKNLDNAYKLINNNKETQEYLSNDQLQNGSISISKINLLQTEINKISVLENIFNTDVHFLMSDKSKQQYIVDANIQDQTINPNKILNLSQNLLDQITTNKDDIIGLNFNSNFLNSLKNNYDLSKSDFFLCQDSSFKQISIPQILFANITDKLQNSNINDDTILISKIKDLSKYIGFMNVVSLSNLELQNKITCNQLHSSSLTQSTIDPSQYVTYYQLLQSQQNLSSVKPSNCLFYNSQSPKNIIVYDQLYSDKFYYLQYLTDDYFQNNTISGGKLSPNTIDYNKIKTTNSVQNGYVLSYDSNSQMCKWIQNVSSPGNFNFHQLTSFPNLSMNNFQTLNYQYQYNADAIMQMENQFSNSNTMKSCKIVFKTNRYNDQNVLNYSIFCQNDSSNYQYMQFILNSTVYQQISNNPNFISTPDNSYRNQGVNFQYGIKCDAVVINSTNFYYNMAVTKNFCDNTYMLKNQSLSNADNSINYMKLQRSVPTYQPLANQVVYIRDYQNGVPMLGSFFVNHFMFDQTDDGVIHKISQYCRTFYNYYSPYSSFSTGQWGQFIENNQSSSQGYRTGMQLGFQYTSFWNFDNAYYFAKTANNNTNLWQSGYYFYLHNGQIYNSCTIEGKQDLIEKNSEQKDYIQKLMNMKLYTYRIKQNEEFDYNKEFQEIKKHKENKDKSNEEIKKIVDQKQKIDLHQKNEIHQNFVYEEIDDSLKNKNKYYKCKKDCVDENCKLCFKCPYENCDICNKKDKCVNQINLQQYLLLGFQQHMNQYQNKIQSMEQRLEKLEKLLNIQ